MEIIKVITQHSEGYVQDVEAVYPSYFKLLISLYSKDLEARKTK